MFGQIELSELVNIVVLVSAFVALLLLYGRLGPALRDMFRGGPRPPSHPIPGDDSRLLTRRRSKATSDV